MANIDTDGFNINRELLFYAFEEADLAGIENATFVRLKGQWPKGGQDERDTDKQLREQAVMALSYGFEPALNMTNQHEQTAFGKAAVFDARRIPDPMALEATMKYPCDFGGLYIHSVGSDKYFGSGLGKSRAAFERLKFEVRTKTDFFCTFGVVRMGLLFGRYKAVCTTSEDVEALLEELAYVGTLCIDDIGIEFSPGFVSFVCELVTRRANRVTYLTSQFPLADLLRKLCDGKNFDKQSSGRLVRRIEDGYTCVPFRRRSEGERVKAMARLAVDDQGGYAVAFKDGSVYRVEGSDSMIEGAGWSLTHAPVKQGTVSEASQL